MNKDKDNEIINGKETYKEIANYLKKGQPIMIGWTDEVCTHYDIFNNRYLILCNQSTSNNNNFGRQRWTCGHEIGHIVCNHHTLLAYEKLSENSLLKIENKDFEMEADYFAATLLSPFPFFKLFNVSSPQEVQRIFYLSAEASANRYEQYQRWLRSRRKTAWENDIVRAYLEQDS